MRYISSFFCCVGVFQLFSSFFVRYISSFSVPCRIFCLFYTFFLRLFSGCFYCVGFSSRFFAFFAGFFTFTFECYKVDDFYFTFFLRFIDVRDLIGIDGKADITLNRSVQYAPKSPSLNHYGPPCYYHGLPPSFIFHSCQTLNPKLQNS